MQKNLLLYQLTLSVWSFCLTWPLTVQTSSNWCGSGTFDLSTKPATGHEVSKDLAKNQGSEEKLE